MAEVRAKHVERRRRDGEPAPGKGGKAKAGARKAGDERWAELLTVAAEMFAERGYNATSLQDIADHVGMLKGSLYYYINSKEDLLYEIVRSVITQGDHQIQELAHGQGSALDRLGEVIRGHIGYLVEHRAATTVFLHELRRLSPERRKNIPALWHYEEVILGLIEEGQEDGSIRSDMDPRLVMRLVLGAGNWVYRWYRPSSEFSPETISDQFAEALTSGLRAG